MPISDYDRAHIGDIIAGQGGWFSARLLRLIANADRTNRARIESAFPDEVEAFERWRRSELDNNIEDRVGWLLENFRLWDEHGTFFFPDGFIVHRKEGWGRLPSGD